MEKVIDVKNLSFGYANDLILHNISFSINKGDFVGVIGPNGSGKSTLIKLLLKILSVQKGEINILGENIEDFKRWDKISYISQKANTINTNFPATVEEVVGANLYSKVGLFKRLNRNHKQQIYNVLETVGMIDYKDRLIGNLSGGQQQRVFIARAIVNQPEIMFLDEPTVGVDVKSEEAVYCLLAKLNEEMGITIVIVTHDIGAITVHANKLACLGNNMLTIHDPRTEKSQDFIKELYGYEVSLHVHKHSCDNCIRRNKP